MLFSTNSVFLFIFGIWKSLDASNFHVKTAKLSMNKHKFNKILENSKENDFNYPIVINTWPFTIATEKGWEALAQTDDPLLAVEAGCSECEEARCDGTVGWVRFIHYYID